MKTKSIVKLLVSFVMLGLVLTFTDLTELGHVLVTIDLRALAVVIVGYSLGQVLSAFKWWNIVRAGGIDVSFVTALKAYYIGMFVNSFGFGTLGGDLARGILVAEGKPLKSVGVTSVVADRAHGLAILALLGTVSAALFGSQTLQPMYASILMGFGISIALGWFIGPWFVRRFVSPAHHLGRKIDAMLRVFPHNPRTVLLITCVSAVFHTLQISLHQVMAFALGASIPWTTLFVVIPFVNIASSLPISWNGLGVRENSYRFFLVPALLSTEQAIAFGAMWLVAVTVSSAIGGIVSVLTKYFALLSEKEQELRAESLRSTLESPSRS